MKVFATLLVSLILTATAKTAFAASSPDVESPEWTPKWSVLSFELAEAGTKIECQDIRGIENPDASSSDSIYQLTVLSSDNSCLQGMMPEVGINLLKTSNSANFVYRAVRLSFGPRTTDWSMPVTCRRHHSTIFGVPNRLGSRIMECTGAADGRTVKIWFEDSNFHY